MSLKRANTPVHGSTDEHPSIEHLRAYHQGRLTEIEEDAVQEHFISCAECRETMLELAEFLDGVSREPRWDVADLVSEWRKIQSALHGEEVSAEVPEELALAGRNG